MIRYNWTIKFLNESISKTDKILDMGKPSEMSRLMQQSGYNVQNTNGEDFNKDYDFFSNYDYDVVSSFEVFEHLFSPIELLKNIKPGAKLIASVPLSVWFAQSHWDKDDKYKRHFHEFEKRQFDWMLEEAGFKIIAHKNVKRPDKLRLGIRPLLRFIFPSYYFVYAEKAK